MNICKLRNVYDATAVASAAHREKFMINMLKYAYYFYACIECTYFRSNISPHVLLDKHFMSWLNLDRAVLAISILKYREAVTGSLSLQGFFYNFAFERFQFDPQLCYTLKVKWDPRNSKGSMSLCACTHISHSTFSFRQAG